MPTVTYSKSRLLNRLDKKLDDKTLKSKISMLGTDLEGINGDDIDVEIFPNRPDLLTFQGFVRAMRSYLGEESGLKKYDVKSSDYKVIIDKNLEGIRPKTACAVVKGLNFDDEKIKEIMNMQEKLHITFGRNRKKAAIGIYPMEKISFPITYKALDPKKTVFKPLESEAEMNGLEILDKHPKGREFAKILENKKQFPYFLDSNNRIMSMPPVINSEHVGRVDKNTKEVFIECSGFDQEYLNTCLAMIVTELADLGGEIYSVNLEYSDNSLESPNLEPFRMKVRKEDAIKVLGEELSDDKFIELVERMGHSATKKEGFFDIKTPRYRSDVLHPIDIVEDICIAYGYNNIEPEFPEVSTVGKLSDMEKLKEMIREIMVGSKLLEVKNYNITSESMQSELLGLKNLVLIENNNIEYNSLRRSLLSSLVQTWKNNLNREYPQRIFELGRIFYEKNSEVIEKEALSVGLAGVEENFTTIKQHLDLIALSFDLEFELKETLDKNFIEGRVAEIFLEGNRVGIIGELSPRLIFDLEMKVPVSFLEIEIDSLNKKIKEINSKY